VGLIFGGIAGTMGVALNFSVNVVEVSCRQTQPKMADCQLKEAKFWGLMPFGTKQVSGVLQAKLNSKTTVDSDGDRSVDYWVSALTKSGEQEFIGGGIKFNGTSGEQGQMVQIVEEVNSFLQSNRREINLIYDARRNFFYPIFNLFLTPFLLVSFFSIVGAFMPNKGDQLVFDKMRRLIILIQPQTNTQEEYGLDQVTAIEVHEAKIEGTRKVFQVYAILKSRGLLILEEETNQNQANRLGKEVSGFLGVPLYQRVV
jgi:hypothetical protein